MSVRSCRDEAPSLPLAGRAIACSGAIGAKLSSLEGKIEFASQRVSPVFRMRASDIVDTSSQNAFRRWSILGERKRHARSYRDAVHCRDRRTRVPAPRRCCDIALFGRSTTRSVLRTIVVLDQTGYRSARHASAASTFACLDPRAASKTGFSALRPRRFPDRRPRSRFVVALRPWPVSLSSSLRTRPKSHCRQ